MGNFILCVFYQNSKKFLKLTYKLNCYFNRFPGYHFAKETPYLKFRVVMALQLEFYGSEGLRTSLPEICHLSMEIILKLKGIKTQKIQGKLLTSHSTA